jgi:hypothetical protein
MGVATYGYSMVFAIGLAAPGRVFWSRMTDALIGRAAGEMAR